jgi:hypothetical protein
MDVTDDGAECRSDVEWNDDSHTVCPSCEKSGKLAEFNVDRVPATLESRLSEAGAAVCEAGGDPA